MIETPERVGLPLHLVDSAGSILKSFGSEDRAYRGDKSYLMYRSLARDGALSIWAAHMHQYQLERWDLEGRLHDVLSRRTDWQTGEYAERRPPIVQDILLDEERNLWVMVIVPLDDWNPSRGGEPDDHFDTIIDVIDPTKQRLLGSTRVDMAFARWTGGGLTYSFSRSPAGSLFITVWRARLERP